MSIRFTLLISLLLSFCLLTPAMAEPQVNEAKARRLMNSLGCKGCHRFEGDGGALAPQLDKIGSRLTSEQIEKHLRAHASTRKKGFMPSYNTILKLELNNLSQFLYNHH